MALFTQAMRCVPTRYTCSCILLSASIMSVSFNCLILFLFPLTSAVRIEKVLVPEVVQSGTAVVLECQYADVGDHLDVQWLFNASERPVYEWRPGRKPTVQGILDGRIDFSDASVYNAERQVIRITSADPTMSGEYTCRVRSGDREDRLTNTMLVFSPEKEFTLNFNRRNHSIEVVCEARGLYPQPELTIERNGVPYPRQQQRVWRNEGVLYDAETTASVNGERPMSTADHVTCRLQLLLAGYTAIKRETLCFEENCDCNTSSRLLATGSCLLLALFANQMQVYIKIKTF